MCLNSLPFSDGGADRPLWTILMFETPNNHALGQDILFRSHICCQQFWKSKTKLELWSPAKVEQAHSSLSLQRAQQLLWIVLTSNNYSPLSTPALFIACFWLADWEMGFSVTFSHLLYHLTSFLSSAFTALSHKYPPLPVPFLLLNSSLSYLYDINIIFLSQLIVCFLYLCPTYTQIHVHTYIYII